MDRKTPLERQFIKAITYFGEDTQKRKAVEEFNEAAVEVQKSVGKHIYKGDKDFDKLVEELADAENMIEQLKIIFDIDEGYFLIFQHLKMNRTMARIEKERKNG